MPPVIRRLTQRVQGRRPPWRGAVRSAALLASLTLGLPVGPLETAVQPYDVREARLTHPSGNAGGIGIGGDWIVWQQGSQVMAHHFGEDGDLVLGSTLSFENIATDGHLAAWADGKQLQTFDLDAHRAGIVDQPDGSVSDVYMSAGRLYWTLTTLAPQRERLRFSQKQDGTERRAERGEGNLRRSFGTASVWTTYSGAGVGEASARLYLEQAGQDSLLDTGTAIGDLAITERWAAWSIDRGRDGEIEVMAYNRTTGATAAIDHYSRERSLTAGLSLDANLLVWSRPADDLSADLWASNLATGERFTVSKAIGDQYRPHIANGRVAWLDNRHQRTRYPEQAVYYADLVSTPADAPPSYGYPRTVDFSIELMQGTFSAPSGKQSVHLYATAFDPGRARTTPCAWRPPVEVWRSVERAPAERVSTAGYSRDINYVLGAADAVPTADPAKTAFYFLRLPGVATRTNVWAHGQVGAVRDTAADTPTDVAPLGNAVDAKVEVVASGDGRPSTEAEQVTVSAMLFAPGTLTSVASETDVPVTLLAGLNNDLLKPVGTGVKRVVEGDGFTYPVWDFNGVDVGAVTADANNKYYFMLEVEGVATNPNVWVHGGNGLTFHPKANRPGPCDPLLDGGQ